MGTGQSKFDFRQLMERLRDPLRLRLLVTGVMLLAGYAAIYLPLSNRIEETAVRLSNERQRVGLANEIDCLRAQVAKFQARLPAESDSNQWVQYVLEGLRQFPLTLTSMESRDPQRAGPYQAVVLHLEVDGEFRQLDRFLHWLETNDRLFRVDAAKIAPARNQNDKLTMQLSLLGLRE